MYDKCEWKNNEFSGCGKLNKFGDYSQFGSGIYFYDNTYSHRIDFCPFCGADIRKPEPAEPLIVKSGETWVAHWEGVDYLCTDPTFWEKTGIQVYRQTDKKGEQYIKISNYWKSFTGPNPDITELTDDIACLRPMIVIDHFSTPCKLLAKIDGLDFPYVVYDPQWENGLDKWAEPRLATAKELEEAK
jgi:hypothetical protein